MLDRLLDWFRGFVEPGTWKDAAAVPISLVVLAGLGWAAWSTGLPSPFKQVAHWWRCNSGTPGNPAYAPNGRWIAFGQPAPCGTRISEVNVRTGRIRILTHGVSHGLPAWSPTGSMLLYSNGSNIKALTLATGRTTTIARDVQEFGAAWSPDGKRLAYAHGVLGGPFDIPASTGTTTLYVARGNGSHARRLLGHNVNGGTPSWSPDGSRIAVVGYEGVYTVKVNGSSLDRIVSHSFSTPGTAAWSPDGQTIAFIDNGQLVTVRADGAGLKAITDCACSTQTDSPTWSPDGQWIAFSASDGIYLIHPDGMGRRRLIHY